MPSDTLLSLPLAQQIGQFFFIGLPGTELDDDSRELIREVQPGGVIIFGRNVAGPQQLRSLLDDVSELVPTPLLFGVDQEGGLVDRLRKFLRRCRPHEPFDNTETWQLQEHWEELPARSSECWDST
jgi:beta-glucosidase-like glycosyl hydrolase